ncbi:MAG: YdcF family protein [Actinomycetota bacterium]|nr:YdcF family protein [Actinomycetota bacterium]
MRWIGRLLAASLLLGCGYVAVTATQVVAASRRDSREPADAILVLGAAQYDGRPSPALRARLDHAAELFDDDVASVIWVTGGQQPGDRFTEASTSSRYLIRQGVPADAVKLENQGGNSYESLAAAARYLRREEQREVLLVSDRWHSLRILSIAREVGLRPRVSPTETNVTDGTVIRLVRETAAVALGRLVGYRRLTGLDERLASRDS